MLSLELMMVFTDNTLPFSGLLVLSINLYGSLASDKNTEQISKAENTEKLDVNMYLKLRLP